MLCGLNGNSPFMVIVFGHLLHCTICSDYTSHCVYVLYLSLCVYVLYLPLCVCIIPPTVCVCIIPPTVCMYYTSHCVCMYYTSHCVCMYREKVALLEELAQLFTAEDNFFQSRDLLCRV